MVSKEKMELFVLFWWLTFVAGVEEMKMAGKSELWPVGQDREDDGCMLAWRGCCYWMGKRMALKPVG